MLMLFAAKGSVRFCVLHRGMLWNVRCPQKSLPWDATSMEDVLSWLLSEVSAFKLSCTPSRTRWHKLRQLAVAVWSTLRACCNAVDMGKSGHALWLCPASRARQLGGQVARRPGRQGAATSETADACAPHGCALLSQDGQQQARFKGTRHSWPCIGLRCDYTCSCLCPDQYYGSWDWEPGGLLQANRISEISVSELSKPLLKEFVEGNLALKSRPKLHKETGGKLLELVTVCLITS